MIRLLTNTIWDVDRPSDIVDRPDSAPPDVPDVGEPPHQCLGVPIHWPFGHDIYITFPWARLGPTAGPDRLPFCVSIQDQGRRFLAHSRRCTERVYDAKVPCLECQTIVPRIGEVIAAVQTGKVPHKTISFSHQQLRDRLLERTQTANQWKLKVFVVLNYIGYSMF